MHLQQPTRPVRFAPSADWDEPGESYASVAETHVSVVVFVGDRAYKIKKPVSFPFLDLVGREAREADCALEVELNRRLAPDVYLGVGHLAGDDDCTEPVVVMRRMPARRRLSTLARAGADVREPVRDAARRLADMHAGLPPLMQGRLADRLRELWDEGFAQMAPFATETLAAEDDLAEASRLAHEYVAGRLPLFAERERDGRVKDGHGDLLAEDIFCLDDGVRILDCLEFDQRLRVGDVLADVGFLAMDVERLGRPDLARFFLDAYAEFAAETHPRSLEHHYIAYRAFVRAKVECLRAGQGETTQEETGALARPYVHQMLEHLRRGRVRLVLLGGLPGSGKTTLAAEQVARSPDDWVLLRSDVIRKEQSGLDPTQPAPAAFGTELYDAAHTEATYGEMLRRAGLALARGLSVMLDATWSDERHRQMARDLAEAMHARVVETVADAPPSVCARRLRHGRTDGTSDATVEVLHRMAAATDPWPAARRVDTTCSLDDSLEALLAVTTATDQGEIR